MGDPNENVLVSEETPLLSSDSTQNVPQGTTSDTNSKKHMVSSDSQLRPVNRLVTIEPLLLLAVAFSSSNLTTSQYMYSRIAQDLNYTAYSVSGGSQCDVNTTQEQGELQERVQQVATLYNTINSACNILPSIISNIFWGSFTDNAGRKYGIIIPMCACALKISLLIVVMATGLPIFCIPVIYFLLALPGGETCIIMTSYAYIADVTTTHQRSLRIFVASLTLLLGATLILISLGYLAILIGYTYTYVALLSLFVPAIIYAVFFLPEPLIPKDSAKFFTCEHFSHVLALFKRQSTPRRTWKLILCIILAVSSYICVTGAIETYNLYFLNLPFCWSAVFISVFMSYSLLVQGLSGMLLIWLTSKFMRDEGRIVIGTATGILYFTSLVLVYDTTTAFIAPLLAVGIIIIAPMARSAATKIVQPDEQGRLQASFAPLEQAGLFLFTFGNNALYVASLTVLRGLNFLVLAVIMVVVLILAVILLVISRKEDKLARLALLDTEAQPDSEQPPAQHETNSG